ncbi:MAG: helix-turn-helix transcriptional regulator [Sedimenticola sp.]
MSVNIIKSLDGEEYVLLPIRVYRALRKTIENKLAEKDDIDYATFELKDYVDNPVALLRIKANITQEELAQRLNVTQAYISKVERQEKVTAKLLERVKKALK